MNKLALALLLILPATVSAAPSKPNPADFPLKVHIVSSASRMYITENGSLYTQILETVIDQQPVELQGYSQGVLALADYPARISTKIHAPNHHPNTYDIYRGYDLLLPDGTTRTYSVTRLGPAPTNP